VSVAIVVLNLNGTEDTLGCLKSLSRLQGPPSRTYVVDNGSVPPLHPSLGEYATSVVLIESARNLGYTGGCNLGARAALRDGAEYVLFLNNDTEVAPDFLGPLVEALNRDPGLGIVTPKIYFLGRDRVIWAFGARWDPWLGRSSHIGVYETERGQFEREQDVGRVTGCAMMVRRDFFDKVGALDDRFFAYGEDVDWSLRARRAGYRLGVVPRSVIWHRGHRTSGKLGRPFVSYLQHRNHVLLLRKHAECFVAGGILSLAYVAAAAAFRVATGSDRAMSWAAMRGLRDGFEGRFGPPPEATR
jgi:GT2 family glycosyltransferase